MARKDALGATPDPAHPAWLAVAVTGADNFVPDGRHLDLNYPKGKARKAMDHTSPFLPGAIEGRIPARIPSGRVEMICAAAETAEMALARARDRRGSQQHETLVEGPDPLSQHAEARVVQFRSRHPTEHDDGAAWRALHLGREALQGDQQRPTDRIVGRGGRQERVEVRTGGDGIA